VERFTAASKDGFFLAIECTDPLFDMEKTRSFMKSLNPAGVWEVEH
jgi:hypothetical protein